METSFSYEDDLLKHYIRYIAWLPACKKRKKDLAQECAGKVRRLRYFTFCASGAVDVLMLDLAKVITRSASKRFDNVVFFERNADFVPDIQKRVPGSIGFPGEFIDIVLLDDPREEDVIEGITALESPEGPDDTAATRAKMMKVGQRRDFIAEFPFDIVNLDLQDFLFKERDELPGRLINCMRKLFHWQQRTRVTKEGAHSVSAFTLMFTTQIGPANMAEPYKQMLLRCVRGNLTKFPDLRESLSSRLGATSWEKCAEEDFVTFFRIAAPKIVASAIDENDWYVDGAESMEVYEFDRPSTTGTYKMLHLVMQIRRKNPPRIRRAPGDDDEVAAEGYKQAVKRIFTEGTKLIDDSVISPSRDKLLLNLGQIKARRKKYESGD